MKLKYKIDLTAVVGKNSYYDEGGSLIIENVVVFSQGEFVSEDGEIVRIDEEAVMRTDWVNLLQGRPVIEGHEQVDLFNYGKVIRGSVKSVKVEGGKVLADIIIQDKSLQDKIIIGGLRSVSLSFVFNGDKVEYINHLGIVRLGQVAEAVINLEKKEIKMNYRSSFIEALNLLKMYMISKKVHTSRLHHYLSCLAKGTPVEFISPSGDKNKGTWESQDRFDGLKDFNNFPVTLSKIRTDLTYDAIKKCKSAIYKIELNSQQA